MKKYSGRFLGIGAALIILAIACFIVLSISLESFVDIYGNKATASDVTTMLSEAEQAASMFGGEAHEYLNVSKFQLFIIKFTRVLRIPLLAIGILLFGMGIAGRKINFGSDSVARAKKGISRGAVGVSTVVKETFDKVTVKCPKCGKVCHSKTAFCPACGEKMPKPEAVVRPKAAHRERIECPNCGKLYHEKVTFCSECGHKIPVAVPTTIICSGCGMEYRNGEKFCSNCGGSLVARTAPAKKPEPVEPAYEDMYFEPKTEETYVAPGKSSESTAYEPPIKPESKPSVTVVTEKKNPFMNKPKNL